MLKKIFRILFRTVLVVAGLILLYVAAAYTLPYIKINTHFSNADKGVKISVISNGVHTDIAVPAKHELKDWTLSFPKDSFDVKDSAYTYIGFGWGDKGFYLNTPTWDDLTFSTAFKAVFGLSETAMHVRYLKERHKETERCVSVIIDTARYQKLIKYIESSFETKEDTLMKIQHPGYGELDRFYEARDRYTLFNTCNIWTNRGLEETGIKVAYWSPLAKGLMHSLR